MGQEAKKAAGILRVIVFISSAILLILGIALLVTPRNIVLIFSAAALVHGLSLIIRYFLSKEARNGWDLLTGIMSVLFGIVMIAGGTETRVLSVILLETYVAIWALIAGISNVFGSFKVKSTGGKNWVWILIGGILTTIAGILLLSSPLMGSLVLVLGAGIYAGISFVMVGLTGVAGALSGKS